MELQYLFSAHHLIVLYVSTKFRENISKDYRVTEWTRFVMDNYGKNYMSPPDGGRHNNKPPSDDVRRTRTETPRTIFVELCNFEIFLMKLMSAL